MRLVHAADAASARQDEDVDGLAQVTVVAERRPTDSQAVPLSIAVVTEEELSSHALRDSVDLTSAVAGLQFDKQGMGAAPFIRGVGTVSGAIGNESPVAVYVDGVYFPTPNTAIFDLDGVRQVEVVKGPQGTLFGRNATGGVIQVETRDPEMNPSADIRLQYGSYSTKRVSAYATGGLGTATAASISLYGRDQGRGWGRNPEAGVPTFRQREAGGRAKLLWQPTGQTRFVLSASSLRHSGEDGLGYHIVPGSLAVDGHTRYSGFYNSASNPQDNASYRHAVLSARLEQELPSFRLVSITSWQNMHGAFTLDQDMTPARIVSAPVSQYGRTITQEVQALSTAGASIEWIVGGYYLNDVAAYDPLALEGVAVFPFDSLQIRSRQHSRSFAVFGQTTVPVSSRARLTFGARHTRDERRIVGTSMGIVGAEGTTLAAARQSADWQRPTWRVALDRDIAPETMAYLSWDRGFKSGLYNLLTYAGAPVSPEVLDAYQGGVKSQWFQNRLRVNVSGFVYRYRNIQVEEIVSGAVLSMNAAAARMRGFDVGLDYAPSRSSSLHAAVALLHGRYTNFKNAPINVPTRNAAGELVGGNTVVPGDATGFWTVRSPRRSATLSGRYRVPMQVGEIGFNVGYYYNSGFAWDPDNRLRQRSYGLLSGSVDWTSTDGSRALRAVASNLNNTEVCAYSSATTLGDMCSPRAPRALSVEWSMKL